MVLSEADGTGIICRLRHINDAVLALIGMRAQNGTKPFTFIDQYDGNLTVF